MSQQQSSEIEDFDSDSDNSSEEDYSDESQDSDSEPDYKDDLKETEEHENPNLATDQDLHPSVHRKQKPHSYIERSSDPDRKDHRRAFQRLLLFTESVSCLILAIGCPSEPDYQPNILDRQIQNSKLALFAQDQYKVLESEEDIEDTSEQALPPVNISTVEPKVLQGTGEIAEIKNHKKSNLFQSQPNEQVNSSLCIDGYN